MKTSLNVYPWYFDLFALWLAASVTGWSFGMLPRPATVFGLGVLASSVVALVVYVFLFDDDEEGEEG